MPEYANVDMDELFGMETEELEKAYNEESAIPSGTYFAIPKVYSWGRRAEDAEFDAGRLEFRIAMPLYKALDETAFASTFDTVSPERRVDSRGRTDAKARKYVELAKSIGNPENPGEFLELLKESPMVKVRIQEIYRVEPDDVHDPALAAKSNGDTVWVRLKADDAKLRDHYQGLGYEPFTMVSSYRRAQ